MIENCVERKLALHRADDGAQDSGHPQQRGEASAESDAAKRGENNENDQSQAKANQHLGRSQFLRYWKLCHDWKPRLETLTDTPCTAPGTRSRASGVTRNCRSKPDRRSGWCRAAQWGHSSCS